MFFFTGMKRATARLPTLLLAMVFTVAASVAQSSPNAGVQVRAEGVSLTHHSGGANVVSYSAAVSPAVARYFDLRQGASADDLVHRALASNGELAAARLDIERARARVRQAGLRPNPSIEFERTTGRLTGSPGEGETSIGATLPLELGGQRRSRIGLAQAELEATEAEIADRERRVAGEVFALYSEALAALRDLEVTEGLTEIDIKTVVIVQARVSEGDAPPIELNLLRAEVDRLRSRRALVEGRLQAALLRLKSIAGIAPEETLRLREGLATKSLRNAPASLEASIEIALRTRPDLRLARLNEEVAAAGLRLARAQASPDVTATARYAAGRATFEDTPVGVLRDHDKTVTFGVSVGIPVFNRNQGTKAEAAVAIAQARMRREFLEQTVRVEVASAYARDEATRAALLTFEQGVIERSNENLRTIRAAYEIGAFRITDLLAEQRRLVDSQRDFTEALAERYRALADLQTAVGAPIAPVEK